MQRWQLTAGLTAGALIAATMVPSMVLTIAEPVVKTPPTVPQPPTPTVDPLPSPSVSVAASSERAASSESVVVGGITMTTALDVGAQLQGSPEERFVVIDLAAEDTDAEQRLPAHIAVVMDNSGSMDGRGKITHARQAAIALSQQLGPNDTLSLVTFSDRSATLVAHGTAEDQQRIEALIRSIDPGGGTNLYAGLTEGQRLLSSDRFDGVKRVIVLSDGMANIGVTDDAELARIAGSLVSEGITVSGLGLGLDYNEDLLASMSDSGGGSYHFVNDPEQLSTLFASELDHMGSVVGRQVAVDVTLGHGIELLDVYGYPAAETADGYRVFLGDIPNAAHRKIVARVRVDTSQEGVLDVASATLTFTDPESEAHLQGSSAAQIQVTTDAQAVTTSVNPAAGQAAATAAAAALLERSAQAYDAGQYEQSTADLEAGTALLHTLAERYGTPELMEIAEEFERTRVEFAAAEGSEGQYQIKRVKEQARVFYH